MNKSRLHKKEDCPFCAYNIHELSFMESQNFLVIYNHAPILPGHSLVIPKNHIESLLELTTDELNEFTVLSMKAAKRILKVFGAESFNWTVQEKPAAGQTISHLHLHIIPRHLGDLPEPGDWYPELKQVETNSHIDSDERPKMTQDQILKVVARLRE